MQAWGRTRVISQTLKPFSECYSYERYGLIKTAISSDVEWSDWVKLAGCTSPEVHELPLVDGITSNYLVYYKNQENIVTVIGSVFGNFPAAQYTPIGNLPEGFRPARTIEFPASFSLGATGNTSVDAAGHLYVASYSGGLRYAYVVCSYPAG